MRLACQTSLFAKSIFKYPQLLKMSSYSIAETGKPYENSYRCYISSSMGPVSSFHDIPLYANASQTVFNMVVEIPRWTSAKMEICKEEFLNPIKQDVKKDQLRFVSHVFPFHGYIWNYGALPQTWEDPSHVDLATQCKGDNDPVDVCEIGSAIIPRGSVIQVKPLGVLAMIDEGETDWKIIAININDPLAEMINDIYDVEENMPGLLNVCFFSVNIKSQASREWFRKYKLPDGKPENKFAFNGEFKGRDFAIKLIQETHLYWEKLIAGSSDTNISLENITVASSYRVERSDATGKLPNLVVSVPEKSDLKKDKWHFM